MSELIDIIKQRDPHEVEFHQAVANVIQRIHPLLEKAPQYRQNALTTLPLGAGAGGSDFDPKGKSDGEVMRFMYRKNKVSVNFRYRQFEMVYKVMF